jgi:outer membrane receptor protein involved in Fe transport
VTDLRTCSQYRCLGRIGRGCCLLLALTAGSGVASAAGGYTVDLVQLPIEQLLNLEVYSASKFAQKVSEAPSAVSVVTADEIKAYGWRTLADILRSMRGLYVGYDRNYSYLGARGFLRPGDYNTRFLLMIDGHRMNDAVYDQALIGSEFGLDVDLIERVEFVPGPGSSIYGTNAFFGVVNVISKRGRHIDGPQIALEAGSFGAHKARASYGWRGASGTELLLSASSFHIDGQDLYFPEFDAPATNRGIAAGLDAERAQSVSAKVAFGPFGVMLGYSERKKIIPTASFSQVFNDPRSHTLDTQAFADFSYRAVPVERAELTARVFWGRSDYQGDYIYGDPGMVNRDGSSGCWWGSELKLVSTRADRHKVVAGAEYWNDYRREQFNFDVEPYVRKLDDRRHGSRYGIYLQDEIAFHDDWLLNAGLRHDYESTTSSTQFNPRLALIYKLMPATTLKALYGTAFRVPNAYELYYQLSGAGGQKANLNLKAEHIRTRELVLEHQFAPNNRMTASLFDNVVSDLITQTLDPEDGLLQFRNMDRATARGVELEFERAWNGGARLRTSYSWQRAFDDATGMALANSPRHLFKLNVSAPLPARAMRAAFEAQYVSSRNTLRDRIGGYWLTNANLGSTRLAQGLELSLGIYNLLNKRYADPGAEEHAMDEIVQDGRNIRLKLIFHF